MAYAEFEEKSYEGPLYNQLERANSDIWNPGQVIESIVGFDRGLYLAESALWEVLGYREHLTGIILADHNWYPFWGPEWPRRSLPSFKLNLFVQAKRPIFHKRKPRAISTINSVTAPLWSFKLTPHQQKLLETLAEKAGQTAHVTYACPTFHTNQLLFTHTKNRSIVQNSTFPPASKLSGHEAWYYNQPGAVGAANPNPERIDEAALLSRLRVLAESTTAKYEGNLGWLDQIAVNIQEAFGAVDLILDAIDAQYFDDLQTLSRIAETYRLRASFTAYAQIRLFCIRFGLIWLVVTA